MRIFFTSIVLVLLLSLNVSAQNLKYCGSTEKEAAARAQDPSILIQQTMLQNFVRNWIQNHQADVRDNTLYVIPIVFHIIHDYGYEDITDDQVRNAVQILNQDYQELNADTSAVVSSFKNIIGDAKIEFRLANKTPDGSCTSGIEHIHSLRTYAGDDDSKLDDWPRADYLNVWTVRTIGDDIAGYAYLPATANSGSFAGVDGVLILSSYVGSIGTGSALTSRALTHEIGHVLGLLHPWGNTNSPGVECGDDGIDDTPVTEGWTSCNLNGSICTPGVIENVQNYMEYSYCAKMFTVDQALAMQATLNTSTAQRNNLWSSSNLVATATDDTTQSPCAPIADFYSSLKMTCTGSAVPFHDVSYNGIATNRTWSFQDGTPSVSSDVNPSVTFSSPGWKTVSLSVSNSEGSNSLSRTSYIYVSDASVAQYTENFFENFEDPNSFSNDWIVFNPEGNTSTFTRVTNAGYNSSSSVKLNNYGGMNGDIDDLISPSFDLSAGGPLYLNFRYTCATNANSPSDENDDLYVASSTNCGQTWFQRLIIHSAALANAGYLSGAYTPNVSSPWVGKSILLSSSLYEPNVRFRFEYKTNGLGNNFYIDDVNVSSYPVGIQDPDAASFSMNVFPNPVTDNSVAIVNQQLAGNVQVKIVDLQGRIVSVLYSGWLSEGQHKFELSSLHLASQQMYLLVADDGLTIQREKFVVQ